MKVAVIGAGSWGTTVAALVSTNAPTVLWAREPAIAARVAEQHRNDDYLPDIDLPPALGASASLEEVCTGADVVVMAVPSHGFRGVLDVARPFIAPGTAVISLAKGLEQGTELRMTQVVADVLPDHRPDRIGVLTGPNLAREVALGQPTASVVAIGDPETGEALQRLFMTRTFRVYTNPDVVGCEIAGALKNVIAIGAGIAAGLGYGDNTKAALITRGLAELARLGMTLGGDPLTFSGLAGMGDLVATCTSDKSRNRMVGVALGQGRKLDEIVAEMKMVAEGVKSTEAVLALARQHSLELPIAAQVGAVLYEGRTPADIVPALMLREAKPELPRDAVAGVIVGALGARGRAEIDARGRLTVLGEDWALDWWIGADDRWRLAAVEPAVRQHPVDATPVVETALRVPGGDAIQRVYGVGGPGGLIVVEVENASPAAFVVAFTIHGARDFGGGDDRVVVDGRPALLVPSPPARWSAGTGPLSVETIGSATGALPDVRDRRGGIEAAVLYPLSHRNRIRIALATSGDDPGPVELGRVASAAEAASGWRAVLDHRMRVVLPDLSLQAAVDLARSQVLLDPDPDAATTAALEDWGHDDEAAWAWRGLSLSARRAARRRSAPVDECRPAGKLTAVHRMLLRDTPDHVELAPALPDAWRGQDLEVHGAPTRSGRVSYALRWHGPNPTLLWEVTDPEPGLVLRAPALDPRWSTTSPAGETLLTPP